MKIKLIICFLQQQFKWWWYRISRLKVLFINSYVSNYSELLCVQEALSIHIQQLTKQKWKGPLGHTVLYRRKKFDNQNLGIAQTLALQPAFIIINLTPLLLFPWQVYQMVTQKILRAHLFLTYQPIKVPCFYL